MKQKKIIEERNDQPSSNYKWEAERLRDRKPVKGVFRFHEVAGGTLNFSFRKWKGDPIESFSLVDGQSYELPLGVATHLKESGWYPIHKHAVDANGVASKIIGQKVKRYNFEPLSFIADERWHKSDADKTIVTVKQL
jgi:hypothetical protein